MCETFDPKWRRFSTIGNACLVIGLSSWVFPQPHSESLRIVQHAGAGFLLGASIAMNLCAVRMRCRAHAGRAS